MIRDRLLQEDDPSPSMRSGASVSKHSVESSPQLYARLAGAFYLGNIILGLFGETVRNKFFVAGDPAATAHNLVTMESLWRVAIATEFIALILMFALAMIYFVLLWPAGKELTLLATFLRVTGGAVQAVAVLNLLGALSPLTNPAARKAFTADQLNAMAGMALKAHGLGFTLALLFTGACFLFHGQLIYRSGFLPRILGRMIQLGGACYLINSFGFFLAPAFARMLFPAILLPAFVAELSLSLWLLIKGVNVTRWKALATHV